MVFVANKKIVHRPNQSIDIIPTRKRHELGALVQQQQQNQTQDEENEPEDEEK